MDDLADLAAREARERTQRIASLPQQAEDLVAQFRAAYRERDWETLGYLSWVDYVTDEFGAEWLSAASASAGLDPPHRPRGVYFAQAADGGLIKIGSAVDPHCRLLTLQTGSPTVLRLLAWTQAGGDQLERELHERFAASRAHGEWFRPTSELLAYIDGVRAGSNSPTGGGSS